jgi:hypothetical protein
MNTKLRADDNGIRNIQSALCAYGHKVMVMPFTWPQFDLLMDGKVRLEVKTSRPRKENKNGLAWKFSIHRHNKLNESGVDFYILRFEGVPGSSKAIHALLRAPLRKLTVEYSQRQMLEGAIANAVQAFRRLNRRAKLPK